MSDSHYSNREIDFKIASIKAFMAASQIPLQETLDRIEGQTTKTNGRVGALERWQSFMIGGLTVVTGAVIPMAIYIVFSLV